MIVLGILGQSPFAGVAWQVLHYLEGLSRLGCEVYYIEDTGDWPYDPEQNIVTDQLDYTINYIGRLMTWCGLTDRWAYCAPIPSDQTYGLSRSKIFELLEGADALINLTGSSVLQDQHLRVPVRIYIETDPVLPQIEIAKGNQAYIHRLSTHTHHLTYGENLGSPDCGIPLQRFNYFPTRQPIILDWWEKLPQFPLDGQVQPREGRFTTIANWRQTYKDIEWKGETYTWSKHHEFLKFIELPARIRQPLELALALAGNWGDGGNAWVPKYQEDTEALQLLAAHGWSLANAITLSKDILPYRDYILGSQGEFTVAKDQNVRLRSGWFSDRSACYLAAGRPVITQDTGFGNILPTGEGLFAFTTMEEIIVAFDVIRSDYARHSRAAKEIAEEYFRAETVLARVLHDVGF